MLITIIWGVIVVTRALIFHVMLLMWVLDSGSRMISMTENIIIMLRSIIVARPVITIVIRAVWFRNSHTWAEVSCD